MYEMKAYAATKAAILSLSVSLAKELAGTGIIVNSASPGAILTPKFEQIILNMAREQSGNANVTVEEAERFFVENVAPVPSDRMGLVKDIAAMVVFLCSPLAGYVNGANLRVDGGYVPTIN